MGEPSKIWGVDSGYSMMMLEGLVRAVINKDGSASYKPVLATSWKKLPDNKSWEFKIRKGVKFHDGTDLDAKAIKYCHDLLKDVHGTAMSTTESIDVVDKYTVRYNLSKPDTMFFTNLTEAYAGIISPTHRETKGVEFSSLNPVGTAPFKFVKYERDVVLVLKKFDDYWEKGLPYLDGVTNHFCKTPLIAQAALESGTDHFMYRGKAKEADILKKKGFNIQKAAAVLRMMTFDSKNPKSVFANKKVREAMGYAVDRETYAEVLSYGYDEPCYQLAIKKVYAYNPAVKPRKYNPEKAKKLLAEAGYPNGFECQLYGGGNMKNLWTAVQRDLGKIGVKAKVNLAPPPKLNALRYKGGMPTNSIMSMHIANRPDFISGLDETLRSTSPRLVQMHRTPGLDDLLKTAITAEDFAKKKEFTRKAVKLIQEDAMTIPIFMETVFWPNIYGNGILAY
ncbi:MAG: ABC transporter substrate-binding protein [Deltaproteobacteria bacterium]|nr:ABC transporter substrate-binding protein [Deltaproteobacteria bacterium]